MMDLIQITNDPALARQCDALPGMRLMVDLERLGKAERQAGRNTFISTHQLEDVGHIKAVLKNSVLMARVNPVNTATKEEVDAVLAQGANRLMLPMFHTAAQVRGFAAIVAGRAPVTVLLETAQALDTLEAWADTPGLDEIFVGLNDLHLSLGCRFMFEPLARGTVDRVAAVARQRGLRFGFGGIARLDEGLLPGRDVLGEHLRLGSGAVILSRTFHRSGGAISLADEVAALRQAEHLLAQRSAAQVEADRLRVIGTIESIAAAMPAAAGARA